MILGGTMTQITNNKIKVPNLKQLAFIKSLNLTKIGGERLTNDLVIYQDDNYQKGSNANQYGYEIAITEDVIVEVGITVSMPEGGYILSGHGESAEKLTDLVIGQIGQVDLTNMVVTIYQNDLFAQYFSTFLAGKAVKTLINETKDEMYDCDYASIDEKVKQLDENRYLLDQDYQKYLNEGIEINNTHFLQKANIIKKLIKEIEYLCIPNFLIEGRAIWHRPNAKKNGYDETTLVGVQKLLLKAKALGIQTILIETLWEGFTIFPSLNVPFQPSLMVDGEMPWYGKEYQHDYLKCITKEARKIGISIHAWTEAFLAGVKGQPLASHIKPSWLNPDYFNKTVMPDNLMYLDPVNPEVRTMLSNFYHELVTNYEIDGVEIDYIRYPYSNLYFNKGKEIESLIDSGYSEVTRAKFYDQYSYQGALNSQIITNQAMQSDWLNFKTEQVSEVVQLLHKIIKEVNPNIIISTAVAADHIGGLNNYSQNWPLWVQNGWIEIVKPMAYTADTEYVANLTKTYTSIVANMAYIYSGIGPVYLKYPVILNQKQMSASILNGAIGSAIFVGYNIFGNEDFELALFLGNNYLPRLSPYDDPSLLVTKMADYLIERIDNLYISKDFANKQEIINQLKSLKQMPVLVVKDYELVIQKIDNILEKINKIKDNVIKKRLTENLSYLRRLFDVLISRTLINTNEWDPTALKKRPIIID